MTKYAKTPIDRPARVLGFLGLLLSACSVGVAGWAAWTAQENRADSAEQVSIHIAQAPDKQETDVKLPTNALVAIGRTITVSAKRETWDVLISNTSLSADMTIIGIWPGQQYTATEPIFDELSEIRLKLTGVPALPITLGPSKTVSFGFETDIPINSSHIPFIQISTSRGGQFIGTSTP